MDPSTIITVLSSFQISHTIGFSALAFLIFDHLLTFIEEVDLFWKPKLTGAAVIFFLNRYIVLSTAFFNNFGFSLVSPKRFGTSQISLVHKLLTRAESCSPLFFSANILSMLQFIPWAVFSATRAFALSYKNRTFTALILFLSLMPMGVGIVHFAFGANGQYDTVFGCIIVDPIDPMLSQSVLQVTIISRACLIVADALLVIATWATASRTMRRGMLSAFNDNSTFEAVLLRDGALYFLMLMFLNSSHVLLTVLSVSGLAFQHASDVIQFVYPATGLLVSRFLLDLQSANRRVLHLDSTFDSNAETIIFGHATFSAASLEAPGASHSSKGLNIDGELLSPDSESLVSEHGQGTAGAGEGKDLESGVPAPA